MIGEVGWHRRQVRQSLFLDLFGGYTNFFALIVAQNQRRPFVPQFQTCHDKTILLFDDESSKCRVDVPIRIKHVFEQSFQSAIADSIELRPDFATFVVNPVTGNTRFLEDRCSCFGSNVGIDETGRDFGDQFLQPFVGRRQALGQFFDLLRRGREWEPRPTDREPVCLAAAEPTRVPWRSK